MNNTLFYINNKFKYKLTPNEINSIDKYWKFIQEFNMDKSILSDYRKKIVNKIQNKYTLEEFIFYERILEKLLFNLQNVLNIKNTYNIIESGNDEKYSINQYLATSNKCFYRSFMNKCFLVNNNKILITDTIGSAGDLVKNNYHGILDKIMFNRNLYEKVYLNPTYINSIEPSYLYYNFDYPFPNIFLSEYDLIKNRKKRIELMYYTDEKYWFKLIK